MKKIISILLFLLIMITGLLGQKRLALIIGNANYDSGVLRNARQDAEDMAAAAQLCGFQLVVPLVLDADQESMLRALHAFEEELKKVPDAISLFYYAGHGIQVNDKNYLISVKNREITDEIAVETRGGLSLDEILLRTQTPHGCNLIILDACRDNPWLTKHTRDVKRGLKTVAANYGTMIMYSTSANSTASDGNGKSRNGIFTEVLKQNFVKTGWSVIKIFQKTAETVRTLTGGKQQPELNLKYYKDLVLLNADVSTNIVLKDSDGDGITDNVDSCPDEAGDIANMGCPNISAMELGAINLIQTAQKAQTDSLSLAMLWLVRLPKILKDLSNLKKLDIGYNAISDISILEHLPHLTSLEMGGNSINDISVLGGMKQLRKLDLTGNPISNLNVIKTLTQLQYLNLQSQSVNNLSFIKNLTQLSHLNASINRIQDLSPLKELKQLHTLELRDNDIKYLLPMKIQELQQLAALDLGYNQIGDVSALRNLKQLTKLLLNNNQVNDLLVLHLQYLKTLTELDLSGNMIQDLSPIKELKLLKALVLKENQISNLSEIHLNNFKQLTELDLSGNQIWDITALKELKQLRVLKLSGNKIKDLTPLKGLTQLTTLYLDSNQLERFELDLDLFPNLVELRLYGNHIKSIPTIITGNMAWHNCLEQLKELQKKQWWRK